MTPFPTWISRSLAIHRLFFGSLLAIVAFAPSMTRGGDWPQILGPSRNGIASESEKLPASLPSRFQPKWKQSLGGGYAGPIVTGQRVIAFHRVQNEELLQAFDEQTGKLLWTAKMPAHYAGGIDPDVGPRCTPVASGDRVVVFGAAAQVMCASLHDGKILWQRALADDFEADEGYFGFGSTPIILGDQVLINLGGKDAGLVALSLATGKIVWNKTDERASYAAPTACVVAGKPFALFVTRYSSLLVDPATGNTKLLTPFGKRGPTVNAATPVLVDDSHLFLSASYGVGALFGKLTDAGELNVLWANDDSLSSQYPTPVVHQGILYGIHGREDVGVAELRAVEAKSGKVLWKQPDFGVAHLIRAGERILALKTHGELNLFAASPEAYRSLGSLKLGEETTRALPALANGSLFFRTTGAQGGTLFCLPLQKEPK